MPQQQFRWLNFPIALAALIFVLASSSRADAIPIPTGTAANDLIINFNFLSPPASPAPPYSSVDTQLEMSRTGVPVTIVLDIYGDLNGGTLLTPLRSFRLR
jgi:hypothetical protein